MKPYELFRPDDTQFLHPDVTAILTWDTNKRLGQLKIIYDNHNQCCREECVSICLAGLKPR